MHRGADMPPPLVFRYAQIGLTELHFTPNNIGEKDLQLEKRRQLARLTYYGSIADGSLS